MPLVDYIYFIFGAYILTRRMVDEIIFTVFFLDCSATKTLLS